MNKIFKQWTSTLLAFLMIAVIIPLPQAHAAASLSITSLYTTTTEAIPASTEDPKISRVTISPVQLTATVSDISEADLPNVYYEVTNISSGVVKSDRSDRAVLTGANEITFRAVELTEGLNRVVLKLESGASTISSQYGWIYFTPSTGLSELKINDEGFVDGGIFPKVYNPFSDEVVISGKANNASIVGAYNLGMDSFEKTYIPDNERAFYFIAGESINDEYAAEPGYTALRGGDNFIRFEARNDSSTYKLEKNIIFNNGKPFPFNTKLYSGPSGTEANLLARQLTVSTEQLTLDSKIKVDKGDGKYTNLTVGVNNSPLVGFRLDTPAVDSIIDTVRVDGTPTISYVSAESTAQYDVYQISLKLSAIPDVATRNSLTFTFSNATGNTSSGFTFNYENTSQPAILSVTRSNLALLSEDVTNDMGSLPEKLIVTANGNTTGVTLSIDGADSGITPVQVGQQFTFTIDQLGEGLHTFVLTPMKGGTAYTLGQKVYKVRTTNSPYIVVKNIYNGMVLDGTAAIDAKSAEGIQGGVQNYSTSSTGNQIKAYLNGLLIGDTKSTPALTLDTSLNFTLPLEDFNAEGGGGLSEGKNTVRFEVYINGERVRTQTYEIYAFTKKAPSFQNMAPVGSDFVYAQTKDKYATKASKVIIKGFVYNANKVEVVKYYKDKEGIDRHEAVVATLDNADSTGRRTVTMAEVLLPDFNSDVRFEFIAKNDMGLSAITAITITREPMPYRVVQPVLITNPKGDLQANVNGNFIKVVIEADNADSVQIGKDVAVLLDPASNDGRYLYEVLVKDLKSGATNINFTIMRGKEKTGSSFVAYNTNTNTSGAAYLLPLSSTMKVFNGAMTLSLPKGTLLKRAEPDRSTGDSYLTANRRIRFGIANSTTGRVDNQSNPGLSFQGQITNANAINRFSAASPLFWVDGGEIPEVATGATEYEKSKLLEDALTGYGKDPYDNTIYFNRQQRNQVIPSSEGTLTLQFDSNIRYEAWRYITVFRYSFDTIKTEGDLSSGTSVKTWTNIGGVVDMQKNTITVPFDRFGYYQVMYMDKSYNDVTSHGYARDALDVLYTRGIMKGKTDYTFSANESITRGEFAQTLVKVFELPLNYLGNPTFGDVLKTYGSTYGTSLAEYKYIETAARAGIIRGTEADRFKPDLSISREDAAVMIARAAELKLDSDLKKASEALIKEFTDGASIQTYSGPSVLAITKAGLIEGIPNVLVEGSKKETVRFEPGQNLSRADASMILIRVLKQQKKIPK